MKERIKDIASVVYKNWWKTVVILASIGVFASGFSFTFGSLQCTKEPVKIPSSERSK